MIYMKKLKFRGGEIKGHLDIIIQITKTNLKAM